MTADHRWQGYSHRDLYAKIHTGPGPVASAASIGRWSDMSRVLAEIDGDIKAALQRSRSGWSGAGAKAAETALGPLAQWAQHAQAGAEVMRLSAELQADYIGKARADMPKPVEATAEEPNGLVSWLVHLFGGQTDYEKEEAARSAAEQRAFEVMEVYQASTTSNTSSLGQFSRPPEIVVEGAPPTRGGGSGIDAPYGAPGMHPRSGAAPRPRGGDASQRSASGSRAAIGPSNTGTTGGSHDTHRSSVPHASGTTEAKMPRPRQPFQTGPVAETTVASGQSSGGSSSLPPSTAGTAKSGGTTRRRQDSDQSGTDAGVGVIGAIGAAGAIGANGTVGAAPDEVALQSDSSRQPARGPSLGTGVAPARVEDLLNPSPAPARQPAAALQPAVGASGGVLGGAAGDPEDDGRHLSGYLVDTENVFGDERMVAPPVIGENAPQ